MLDFEADSLYTERMFNGLKFWNIIFSLMLLFTLFSVGIFTSYIDGGNFYSEEELLKKFPPPTPRPTNFPQTISSTPEKFDQVFYAL